MDEQYRISCDFLECLELKHIETLKTLLKTFPEQPPPTCTQILCNIYHSLCTVDHALICILKEDWLLALTMFQILNSIQSLN